ncbi:hypothetical protein [Actinokineospora sp. NBRC 105648]|uniref:hypothetical protein n=1 Tax=Actinokineospora sp. NBRC 105648 TaxID=3032206 RepID=UPI0024A2F16C|nr:hypothetical protein [Actinokineospora sp. NBRC 105648]GLZ37428.1 hypothetical protein Acsp05_10530 [Actinokineospora sp. NBRC 105648]
MDKQQPKETPALRRVLSRTLLVLGGTVASTAAAWAISTATAAADVATDLQDDLRSVVDSVPALDAPALGGPKALVTDLTDRVGALIGEPMSAPLAPVAIAAVDQVGRDLAGRFTPRIDLPASGAVETVVPDHSPVLGATELPGLIDTDLAAPPAAEQRVQAQPGPVGADLPVADAGHRAVSHVLTRRGSPEPRHEAPALPTGPSPLAPLSMPAPANSGHTANSAADANGLGQVATAIAGTDTTSRALCTAQVRVPAVIDAQPGVTPD